MRKFMIFEKLLWISFSRNCNVILNIYSPKIYRKNISENETTFFFYSQTVRKLWLRNNERPMLSQSMKGMLRNPVQLCCVKSLKKLKKTSTRNNIYNIFCSCLGEILEQFQ